MKILMRDDGAICITPDPENRMEKGYIKTMLERLTWTYSDTEILVRANGVPIVGKRET